MAESTFTLTGVTEMRAAVNQLPDRVTSALKAVARETASRVLAGAKARLLNPSPSVKYPSPGGASSIANAMHVVEDGANKQFVVVSPSPPGKPANLVLWRTYGTVKQPPRPYLGPAAKGQESQYQHESEVAALEPVREALE